MIEDKDVGTGHSGLQPSWETGAQMRRIVDLVQDFSIETVPVVSQNTAASTSSLRPNAPVYVVSPPGRPIGDVADTAIRLKELGFKPIPHIAARSVRDHASLETLLRRVTGEAGVDQVLVVGGTRFKPMGEFDSAVQILSTGLLEKYGIRRVGFAGHPEGHPYVEKEALMQALRQKIELAQSAGADVYILTQFCFDPHVVVDWEIDIRNRIGDIPVHIGIPGPASLTSLVRYARMCNVGESVRILTRGASTVLKLTTWTPDNFLTALAYYKSANPGRDIARVHFFSFGGIARTSRWLSAICDGKFIMHQDGRGFSVEDGRSKASQ